MTSENSVLTVCSNKYYFPMSSLGLRTLVIATLHCTSRQQVEHQTILLRFVFDLS